MAPLKRGLLGGEDDAVDFVAFSQQEFGQAISLICAICVICGSCPDR